MLKNNPTNHDLFGLWGNDLCSHIFKKKFDKKIKSSSFGRSENKYVVIFFFGPFILA